MTLLGMQIYLEQFDELFIRECKSMGMTEEQTRRTLYDNPTRKAMIEKIVESESLSMEPNPRILLY